jgi:hypothetical protein
MKNVNFDPPDWFPTLKAAHVRMVRASNQEARGSELP